MGWHKGRIERRQHLNFRRVGLRKEVLAQYLHSHSNRVDKPFVAVNCAAIREHARVNIVRLREGAYTGAHQARAGKFEQANGGTILLDEISEDAFGAAGKLLRVLQGGARALG